MTVNKAADSEVLLRHSLSGDVTACDSALLFSVKALLFPATAALTLTICLWIWQRPMLGPYFLIGVLGFAGAAEFIELAKLEYCSSIASALRALSHIAARWLTLSLSLLALLYLSRVGVPINDPPLITWLIVTPFVLWATYCVAWILLLKFSSSHMHVRSAVIVGATEHGAQLHRMLREQPLLGIRCEGFFNSPSSHGAGSVDTHDRDASEQGWLDALNAPVLGTLEELPAYVRKHHINVVYITLPMSRNERLLKLIEDLHDTVASIYFVPDIFAMSLIEARVEVVHGVPLIAICESPFYGMRGSVKRFSDVIISAAILLLIAPVMIAIALAIKATSAGPVIFKQRRYGLDGREIMVYKFRSMTVTEDGAQNYLQVTRNDSRVTPLGALLRRTSLDELPQFLNVLEGSMSIVGPRPHAVAVNERYRVQIPSYMLRHKVKPGITGWAQVNGYRGGDDLHTMTKRIEFDLNYLANWSLLFDLKIILRTLSVVVRDHHAF